MKPSFVRFAWLWSPWLAASLCALGCESEGVDPTGGETHFLRTCDPEQQSCGEGLICLCGTCTLVCDNNETCGGYPEAQCVSPLVTGCDSPMEARACEVNCSGDEQCHQLSRAHRCVDGRCRLGEPLPPDTGDGGSAPTTDTDEPSCEGGDTTANEVLLIGDSFLAATHQITAYLEEQARSFGPLAVGERYRDYSRPIMNALALNVEGIASQYNAAVEEAPAKLVIMNGGGADVLLGSCEPISADCALVQNAASALRELLSTMSDDGVQAVIYLGYPDPQPPQSEAMMARMNVLRPVLEQVCLDAPLPCTWLDLRAVFDGQYAQYISSDGLNPTALGSAQSAEAIWQVMSEQCLAQ